MADGPTEPSKPDVSPPKQVRARRVVVPIPMKRELSPEHVAMLEGSGLTAETMALAELYTEVNPRSVAVILQHKYPKARGPALVFPYRLPDAETPHSHRVRPANPEVEIKAGKPRARKYDQSSGSGLLVYFPPRSRLSGALKDTAQDLVITEGEKKALLCDQLGYPTLGFGGVWNWPDSEFRRLYGGEQLHPTIAQYVAFQGRTVRIAFDADYHTNPQVQGAVARLAGVLYAVGAARVLRATPPAEGRAKGIDDYFVEHGEAATRALLESAVPSESVDPREPRMRVRTFKVLADAPVPDACVMPDGYELRDDGSLWADPPSRRAGPMLVSHVPVFIARVFSDAYSGEGRVELTYKGPAGNWLTVHASRSAMVDARTMVAELGPYGAPVTSTTAGRLVDWFAAFAAVNADHLPRLPSVARSGWHAIGERRAFVLDGPVAQSGVAPVDVVLDLRGERRRTFAALRPKGTVEGHLAALRRAWTASPVCAAMITAACAAPWLEPLSLPNFAVHASGDSSKGKTTALKIGASVFGDPNDRSWLPSWNTSAVGAELRAATLCDLPNCYDEVGTVGGPPDAIVKLVYTLINGTGKTRGQRDLTVRDAASWRTIVLSTGEQPLASERSATGAQVRVVNLRANGFDDLDASQIDELVAECAANAGSFGREYIETLLGVQWEDWVYNASAAIRELRDRVAKDGLTARVSGYFGLLVIVEEFLTDTFGLGSGGETMRALFESTCAHERIEPLAERAWAMVEDWIVSEPDAWPQLEIVKASNGHDSLIAPIAQRGARRAGFRHPDGRIYILPSEFSARCGKAGISPKVVLQEWTAREWLEDSDGRAHIDGARARYIILRSDAS